MKTDPRKTTPDLPDCGNVIAVRVSDKQAFQIEPMLLHEGKYRFRLPSGVEQRRFFRFLVPNQETIDCHALLGRDHRQLPPPVHVHGLRLPTIGHLAKFSRVQRKQTRNSVKVETAGNTAIFLEIPQLLDTDRASFRYARFGNPSRQPPLENNIANMIFQAHGARLAREDGKANAKPHPALSLGPFGTIVVTVMRFFFACFCLVLGLAHARADDKQPPKPPVPDKIESEYQSILEADDKAREDIDKWILEEGELRKKGAGVEISTLDLRIEQRRKKVEEKYRHFILRNPRHARVRLAFGSFLNELGRQHEAAEQWEKAREVAPENPAVWNNLANFYGHAGPVMKAFKYYYKAIELAPFESVYHHNLAVTVYLFRKDAKEYFKTDEDGVFDKALEHYRKAMELDPKNFELATDYAQSYYGIRPPRIEAGLKAWQDARKLARDDFEREGIDIHLARFEIHAGRFDAARKRLASIKDERYVQLVERVRRSLEGKQAAAKGISEVEAGEK